MSMRTHESRPSTGRGLPRRRGLPRGTTHRATSAAGRAVGIAVLLALPAAACGGDPAAPKAGEQVEITLAGLRPLNPATEGSFEVWVHGDAGEVASAGRPTIATGGPGSETRFTFTVPVPNARSISVTVEPPGDANGVPSEQVLLAGDFKGDRVELAIEGAVTDGRPLQADPGSHSLFTTSNNIELGYPSFENAGLWLFTLLPSKNKHQTREVHVTPLEKSWLYEGWIVRDYGTPGEIWVSYGKFRPDILGLLTSRDDTGSGPFSGDEDYLNGGVEDVPGGEWNTTRVADVLGFTMPGGLELPLALDAVDPVTGDAVWTHVITIEPSWDEGENLNLRRPFFLQPYRNPVGEGRPGDPRLIEFKGGMPSGEARLAR